MILFVIMSCLSQISSQWHFIFPEILSIIFLYVASQPPGWKRWAQRELTRLVINAANSRSFISGLRLALLSSSLSPRLLCQSAALSFSSPPESPSSAPPPAPAAHHPAIPPPPAAITTSCQEKEPLSQCVCEWLCVCVCAEAIQEKKKNPADSCVEWRKQSSGSWRYVTWHTERGANVGTWVCACLPGFRVLSPAVRCSLLLHLTTRQRLSPCLAPRTHLSAHQTQP